MFLLCATRAIALPAQAPTSAQTFTTLFSFDYTDGANPETALVQATDGNFYGTTGAGGANGNYGTVFKITPSGALTTLHSFDGTDGDFPVSGLIQAIDGNLYGTTINGGANGYGTVFKITSSGTLTTLHSFNGADGANPDACLLVRPAGRNIQLMTAPNWNLEATRNRSSRHCRSQDAPA